MYLLPGRMKLQPKPQNIPIGMQTSTATVKNSVEIPLKILGTDFGFNG